MTRLGYTQASVATVSEHVMQKATRACLLACACLHSAEPKLCAIAIYDLPMCFGTPQPFLADLEFAHFSPWKVILITHHGMLMQAAEEFAVSHITLAVQVKQDFSFKDWDEGTLDDMGRYTPQSDIYQVGVMLLKSRRLSAAGISFAQKLKSKTINAIDAAEDPYLQTPTPMC